MNAYEQKKAARADRFRKYSENAAQRSESAFEQADKIMSFIPSGQPILVGHHSERRHRRDIEKVGNNISKGFEEKNKAEYWAKRAENAEDESRIDSDDPAAKTKLENKVTELEKMSVEMKRINAEFKANGGKFSEIEMSDVLREIGQSTLTHQAYYKKPFAPYALSNLRQQIATVKKRIADISRADSFKPFEVNNISVTITDGQIQVKFGFKPDYETRTSLKTYPASLKWSRWSECWVRKYTGQGAHYFEKLKQILEGATCE